MVLIASVTTGVVPVSAQAVRTVTARALVVGPAARPGAVASAVLASRPGASTRAEVGLASLRVSRPRSARLPVVVTVHFLRN